MTNDIQPSKEAGSLIASGGEADPYATRVAKLLRRLAKDEVERFEIAKDFVNPFSADELLLKGFRAETLERLKALPIEGEAEFGSVTRYADRSTVRYATFDDFLAKAGNKKDPEAAFIVWRKFFLQPDGEPVAGEVKLSLVTEKNLEGGSNAPGQLHHASINLSVSGSDQDWVERTFGELTPHVAATRLGGLYRPLWIFRNRWFIDLLTYFLSASGFSIGLHFSVKYVASTLQARKDEVLQTIKDASDASQKIDLLANWIFNPIEQPWWGILVGFGASAFLAGSLFIAGMGLLPRLTPQSSIAIGLSSRRTQTYLNVFRFLLFSGLILGIVVPLTTELIKKLF